MQRLRIAHVTAVFPPYWSGTGNVAYYNALELARRGHEVHVFTAQYPLNGYRDPAEIMVHRLWTSFRLGNAPLTTGLVTRLKGFDLIHLHWPYIFGAELTWLASMLRKMPYVMTYHLDLKADRKWIFGPYQRLWGPVLAHGARKVLAVSTEHLKSTQVYGAIKHRPEDIVEVPNGVDIERFNPHVPGSAVRRQYGIPDDAPVILFVGAMDQAHEYKGVPDLIEAFQRLNAPQAWLLLVGGGDLLPGYQALAAQSPLHNQIIFSGAKAYDQLPAYYTAADVCVLPSRQPESFGMVLAEAMACGKPVVASDSPGVRSVVTDGEDGLLVPPGNIGDLVEKLQHLLTDAELRGVLGQRGRAKVEARYAWAQAARRLEEVYFSVLSGKSQGF